MSFHFIKRAIMPQGAKQKPDATRKRARSSWALTFWIGIFLISARAFGAPESVKKTSRGLLIHVGQAQVELAAVAPDILRLSIFYNHQLPPIASSFLADTQRRAAVAWHTIEKDGFVGIETKAGSLLMNPSNREWTLQSTDGESLIPKHSIGNFDEAAAETNQQINIQLGWNKQIPADMYGCGNGVNSLIQHEAKSAVYNGKAILPYYWSKAGYAAFGVTADDNRPASWHSINSGAGVQWTFPGARADLYLMPAASLKDAAKGYMHLTGAAPVPPRWTFGYLQSRWGWTNQTEVDDALKHFQELQNPVDAFIFDFEWYTRKPDYELAKDGVENFQDFGWNTNLFANLPVEIKKFKAQGVRFIPIRKPRLGDKDLLVMMRANGWDMNSHMTPKNDTVRDLDFGLPEVREWYIQKSAGLFGMGFEGWWNDEGESTYTTYYNWNLAERIALDRYRPNSRLWTLNRAFSPGMQRLGAATWTGDINSSWDVFRETPVQLLNWSLAGMPYGACDIGGFFGNPSDELISRWMEAGVFFPIMRTHSEVHYKPHFPWLYGTNATAAIIKAIDLRMRLLPYYYSLAHETFNDGQPLMRPLVMEFPDDKKAANMSDEWLMGESLLAAPILNEGGKRSVYLPTGDWYVLGSNKTLAGNRTIEVAAALNEIPAYVRAGTILPLGPVIQNVTQQPGGPLEVQIYPGKDATFTLVEDDGVTENYLKGQTRRTVFTWDDDQKQLRWKREGNYSGKDVFKEIHVVVFAPHENSEANCPLTSTGAIKTKPQITAHVPPPAGNSSARRF